MEMRDIRKVRRRQQEAPARCWLFRTGHALVRGRGNAYLENQGKLNSWILPSARRPRRSRGRGTDTYWFSARVAARFARARPSIVTTAFCVPCSTERLTTSAPSNGGTQKPVSSS